MRGDDQDARDPRLPSDVSPERRVLGVLALAMAAAGSVLVALSAVDLARGVRFALVVAQFRTEWVSHPRALPTFAVSVVSTGLAVLVGVVAISSRRRDVASLAASAVASAVAIMAGVLHTLSAVRAIAEGHPHGGATPDVATLAPLGAALAFGPLLVAATGVRRRGEWSMRLAPLTVSAPLVVTGGLLGLASLELRRLDAWALAVPVEGLVEQMESAELAIALAVAPVSLLAGGIRGRPAGVALALGWLATGAFLFIALRPLAADAADHRHDAVLRDDALPAIGAPALPAGAVCERPESALTLVLPDATVDGGRVASAADLTLLLEMERQTWLILHAREPFAAQLALIVRDAEHVRAADALPWLRVARAAGYERLRLRHETVIRWATRSHGELTRRTVCDRVLRLTTAAPNPLVMASPLVLARGAELAVGTAD